MEPIRYIGDVQRLALNPGDTIVLTVDQTISDIQRTRLRTEFERMFTGAYKVLVLDKGWKIGVMGNDETSTAED